LVTCTHASNVLGTIHDIEAIAETVHTVPGAMLCVDAVAYAPHRRLDVKALDVDFYCFSWYKVYGPHIAMLYAREAVQDQLESLGHFFHPADLEHKLGLAAANYEAVQAIPEIVGYLGGEGSGGSFEQIAAHEERLAEALLGYLRGRGDVMILGEKESDSAKRVPTVSFLIEGKNSQEVVETVERKSDFGFRWGHFYSKRLVEEVLGCGEDGVIRVSMVHYNTGMFSFSCLSREVED